MSMMMILIHVNVKQAIIWTQMDSVNPVKISLDGDVILAPLELQQLVLAVNTHT